MVTKNDTAQVLRDLYESEINGNISWFWDGGFDLRLGDSLNGFVAEGSVLLWEDIGNWFIEHALQHYPNSVFASVYANYRVSTNSKSTITLASSEGSHITKHYTFAPFTRVGASIPVVDNDVDVCARVLDDRLLVTNMQNVVALARSAKDYYSAAHVDSPLGIVWPVWTKWIASNDERLDWFKSFAYALCREFRIRFGDEDRVNNNSLLISVHLALESLEELQVIPVGELGDFPEDITISVNKICSVVLCETVSDAIYKGNMLDMCHYWEHMLCNNNKVVWTNRKPPEFATRVLIRNESIFTYKGNAGD